MACSREVYWRDRLDVVDFTVIRAQMAKELGVNIRMIAECDVRARMRQLRQADEAALLRLYPPNGERPERIKKWPLRKR
jgi:hypothetical protein